MLLMFDLILSVVRLLCWRLQGSENAGEVRPVCQYAGGRFPDFKAAEHVALRVLSADAVSSVFSVLAVGVRSGTDR